MCAVKSCYRCKKELALDNFSKDKKQRDGLTNECKRCRSDRWKERRAADPLKDTIRSREERRNLRKEILEAYGGKCECCGESRPEFLALDHRNGGGNEERRKAPGRYGIHRKVRREGFPAEYRLLCHNCNSALGFYGYCPHERERNGLDTTVSHGDVCVI